MKILGVKRFTEGDLIDRLRKVSMLEDPKVFPYADAVFTSRNVVPEHTEIAQRYVLKANLHRTMQLKWALEEHGIDLFDIQGYVQMSVEIYKGGMVGEPHIIDLLPPIVENVVEPNGKISHILNDGMHRAYSAHLCNSHITVMHITGIPKHLPYYAYPIQGNNPWDKVEILDSIPEGYIKKWHRTKDNKKLYRNFNSAFENVGGPRGATTPAQAVTSMIANGRVPDRKVT